MNDEQVRQVAPVAEVKKPLYPIDHNQKPTQEADKGKKQPKEDKPVVL